MLRNVVYLLRLFGLLVRLGVKVGGCFMFSSHVLTVALLLSTMAAALVSVGFIVLGAGHLSDRGRYIGFAVGGFVALVSIVLVPFSLHLG